MSNKSKFLGQWEQILKRIPQKGAKNLWFFEYHMDFQPTNFAQSYRPKTLLITLRVV